MHLVLTATIVMASLGIFFGIILAFFSRIFKEKDTGKLVADIYKVLPHVNCGACGYPSCMAFAKAIAEGTAKYDECKVGRQPVADNIKKILGK